MKKYLVVLAFAFVFLKGCAIFDNKGNDEGSTQNECIPPLVTFAFPLIKEPRDPSLENILPSSPWQTEVVLPPRDPNSGRVSNWIMFTRSVQGNTEIWVVRDYDKGEKDLKSVLLIYDTDKKEWHEVPNAFTYFSPTINKLYEHQGHIWAYASWPNKAFGVYDETDEKFRPLEIAEQIPKGQVFFDHHKGIFWIFESLGAIYSMDPLFPKVIKHFDIPDIDVLYGSVAFAPDGSIYALGSLVPYVSTKGNLEISKFDPENNIIEKLYNPSYDLLPFFNLFVDRSGNLWLDDHAWMTPEGIWYEVIRSPVFITDKAESNFYLWDFPEIILESSDDRLWFKSLNGMVSLNSEKGEWCWFTTERSNIVEDQDHNLWMIADGKLYRQQIKLK